jgi:hypothetical protein
VISFLYGKVEGWEALKDPNLSSYDTTSFGEPTSLVA